MYVLDLLLLKLSGYQYNSMYLVASGSFTAHVSHVVAYTCRKIESGRLIPVQQGGLVMRCTGELAFPVSVG